MAMQKKPVPSAKIVTFVAFGALVALCALFFVGLVDFGNGSDKTYGILQVIDHLEVVFKDVGGYFEGIIDTVNTGIDHFKEIGLANFCMGIILVVFPLIALLFFVVIAVKLLFCWLPLARVRSIGWSRASIRMSKKLRKLVGWVLAYMILCFTLYGKGFAAFSICGFATLSLIALFIIGRVWLDQFGKKDGVASMVLHLVSSVLLAAFFLFTFVYLLLYRSVSGNSLWNQIFVHLESVVDSVSGKAEDPDALSRDVMFIIGLLLFFFAMNAAKGGIKKQITLDHGGVRKSAIFLCVWVMIAATLDYVVWTSIFTDSMTFGLWKDLPTSKYIMTAAICGVVGINLIIATGIMRRIGTKKEPEENVENQEPADGEQPVAVAEGEEGMDVVETVDYVGDSADLGVREESVPTEATAFPTPMIESGVMEQTSAPTVAERVEQSATPMMETEDAFAPIEQPAVVGKSVEDADVPVYSDGESVDDVE